MKVKDFHIVIIVQARVESTRLPGKVLLKVKGKTLLSYLLERLKRSQLTNTIVVATTKDAVDDKINQEAISQGVSVFKGDPHDVLDRYYQAAKTFHADIIVRITADCPLIDPYIIDQIIQTFITEFPSYDYVSNTLKRTFPRGMDIEVFSFKALERAAKEAVEEQDREHVTRYFYTHQKLFSLKNIESEQDYHGYRWTVDTQEDFELVSKLIDAATKKNPQFHYSDLLSIAKEHPDWMNINAHIKQKS